MAKPYFPKALGWGGGSGGGRRGWVKEDQIHLVVLSDRLSEVPERSLSEYSALAWTSPTHIPMELIIFSTVTTDYFLLHPTSYLSVNHPGPSLFCHNSSLSLKFSVSKLG